MALVLDESHRIKTPDACVTKAVLELRADAKRRYLLTGTPVANKPEDLWSQLLFLDDGQALGTTLDEFRSRYCTAQGGYRDVDELRERISALSMRRLKDTTIKLPSKEFKRIHVDLTGRQKSMYVQMRNELALWVKSLNGEQILKQADAILARLVRLAQLASNPGLLDASYRDTPAKFTALDALLSTYMKEPQQKAIIWTSFVENVTTLAARYGEYSPVTLYGDMTPEHRDDAVRAFRNDRGVRLLVANPAAAREGLTLTEANVAIYVDRTFNLVDYLQSQDRIHRISQSRPCEIVPLLANDTIDAFVDYSLEQKHRLAQFAQKDVDAVSSADLALSKPDVLRALLWPDDLPT
jgi:SNF2 family DNA or RNA helicase